MDEQTKILMRTPKDRGLLELTYMAKDVLEAVSKSLGHEQIDTVAKQSQQGYWMIITKTIQDANTLLDLEDLYKAKGEG